MAQTFTCDSCGRDWDVAQMKEVFVEGRDKQQLCPGCLDKRMNESERVVGVSGDEKRRAAATDVDERDIKEMEEAGRGVYGERRAG